MEGSRWFEADLSGNGVKRLFRNGGKGWEAEQSLECSSGPVEQCNQ